MNLRHETKHEIIKSDMLILRQRLSCIMEKDPHAINGIYEIRSLYFDTPGDKALREKIDGVGVREKFRIRLYNKDSNYIVLEKKSKIYNLTRKEQAVLSKEEAEKIAKNEYDFLIEKENPLFRELYLKMKNENLRAKTVIDYTREPYIFRAGNVRVTMDYNIRTSLSSTDFLNFSSSAVPVCDDAVILEIKWDEFLPDIIKNAVSLDRGQAFAFSKYAAGRTYI